MNEFGIRLYDGGGVEYLKADSYSMRTVFSLIKPGISPSGEDVPIPSFDPDKGVVMGKFPDVILRFMPSLHDNRGVNHFIMAVHFK